MAPTLEPLQTRDVPSFLGASYYRASLQPASVAVGDLNGDDLLDLVMADRYGYGGPVLVWLGNGDGTLRTPPTTVFFGTFQFGLVLGDFNHDAIPDLGLTTGTHPDTGRGRGVHLLVGRGDGTFDWAFSRDPGEEPMALALGDFNADGHLDLAVILIRTGDHGGLQVLLGNGDGTFQSLPIESLGRFSRFPTVGDFNGDGQLDLLVTSPELSSVLRGEMRLLLGNGDGTFAHPLPSKAGRNPTAMAVADFNGDGDDDVAVVNHADSPKEDGSVAVLLGNGGGTFQEGVHYPIGRQARTIAVGDFNRDCLPDLATGYLGPGDVFVVGVFRGRGDGTFWEEGTYPTGHTPASIAVGDFNGDEYPDLVTSNTGSSDIAILLNAADWVHHGHTLCDPSPGPAPAPGTPGDRRAAVAASLAAPRQPVTAPIPVSTFALDARFNIIPDYTDEIIFWSTDPRATTPEYYRFQRTDQGIASFPGGVTFRTPGTESCTPSMGARFMV
jgi:hypothetical protein